MTPLAVFIHQPNRGEAMVMPIHPGATAYYDREKPGFLVEYADFVGLVLSVALMLASSLVWLRSLISNQQKNKADTYAHELIDRTQSIRQCVDPKELSSEHRRLLIILADVLDDLDHDRVNVEGFTFFSFTWNVALSELRERQVELRELAAEGPPPQRAAARCS